MIERYLYNNTTWFDVVHPTNDEIRQLFRECHLPSSFADDLTSMTPRSDAKEEKGCVKVTLDFPVVKRTDISHPHEVKFIATKNCLITVRFEDIQAVERFKKELEVTSLLKKKVKTSGGHLLVMLLGYLYQGLEEKLDYLESRTQEIEHGIMEQDEKELLFDISQVSRRIILFQHTLMTHDLALRDLSRLVSSTFGVEFQDTMGRLSVTYRHLLNRATSLLSSVRDLRQTNSDLLTAKQNEVMKLFTIMAFITFPLTLFTSLFGMNTAHTPLVSGPYGFWYILFIMSIASAGFFMYFKYKKWL